eukprot:7581203-Pyramimonas_sp.AAC.4
MKPVLNYDTPHKARIINVCRCVPPTGVEPAAVAGEFKATGGESAATGDESTGASEGGRACVGQYVT